MHRAEATHVAIGSAFLGVGGVAISILIPLAAAAKEHPWTAVWFLAPCCVAGVLGLAGFYMLAAIYTGWWLPPTASERKHTPRLQLVDTRITELAGSTAMVLKIGTTNIGHGDVNGLVNLVVPNFIKTLDRCTEAGVVGNTEHRGGVSTTSESLLAELGAPVSSIYWNGNITFPGRSARIFFLRVEMDQLRGFPARLTITSADMPDEFSENFAVALPQ